MTPERWARIRSVFSEALQRPDADRMAWLNQVCGDDEEMRADVTRLIAAHEEAGTFISRPAADLHLDATLDQRGGIIGRSLHQYELESLVGSGGMGEVYRARDHNLDRDVAIKLLPETVSADPDRIARFEREAKALAAVNHPNVAHVYGFEHADGLHALVMELVEGPTLAERLTGGSIAIDEALQIAGQIADALEAAHALGIVHRDLKPANIKITRDGTVKVLDFGLAKVTTTEVAPRRLESQSSTVAVGSTRTGMLLGTAGYMSPEQARGEAVDHRTDIWAFGCVLYEMLAAGPAFPGETVVEVIAAVLEREPDWARIPARTPARVQRLLRRCLEKDASRRLFDIRDARVELAASRRAPRRQAPSLVLVAAGSLVVAAATAVFYATRSPRAVTSASEYTQLTAFAESAVAPNLSPDGRMMTFKVGEDFFLGRGHIYVKPLPTGEAVRLTNERAQVYGPVFTPDGTRVAYTQFSWTGDEASWDTWTVPVLGGPPARLLPNASGLTWIGDRRVMFAEIASGLHMGIVTATESRSDSRRIYFPAHEAAMAHYSSLSPDGKSVLVVEMDQTHAFGIPCRLVPFDGSSSGRQVGPKGTCTAAAWSPDGRWMYFGVNVNGTSHLWRQRYPSGTPEQITFGPSEEEGIAIAPDGRSLITSLGTRQSAVWIRDGTTERPVTSEGYASQPHLSRNGSRVFYLLRQNAGVPAAELRVIDLASGRVELLLPGISLTDYDIPADETVVAFTTQGNDGQPQVWVAPIDRSTPPRLISRAADQPSFGPAGDIVFRSLESSANALVRMDQAGRRRTRISSHAFQEKRAVSPDGRWVIVFGPSAGGEHAVPGTWAVPVDGGSPKLVCVPYCETAWSADGRYFYMAVNLSASTGAPSRTLAIPIAEGESLPQLPTTGINAVGERDQIEGAVVIDHAFISPGPNPSVYAFTKSELHRNLFRIPLH